MQGRHGHLSAEQRQLAFRLRARGWRLVDIARLAVPGRWSVSWCARAGIETPNHCDGSHGQGACRSEKREQILLGIGRARAQARRPKPCKLRRGRLLQEVSRRLERLWSPQQISRRLRLEYPDDPGMRVSPETVYQSLFVQGHGFRR